MLSLFTIYSWAPEYPGTQKKPKSSWEHIADLSICEAWFTDLLNLIIIYLKSGFLCVI